MGDSLDDLAFKGIGMIAEHFMQGDTNMVYYIWREDDMVAVEDPRTGQTYFSPMGTHVPKPFSLQGAKLQIKKLRAKCLNKTARILIVAETNFTVDHLSALKKTPHSK